MASPGSDKLTTALNRAGGEHGLIWFKRVVWAGIAANILVALISITWPAEVLAFLKLEPAQPLIWPRFAVFLLILLSIFYIPAATDPERNRFSAIFCVICRFGGVLFFLIVGGGYILFGLFDFVFGLPEAILLWSARHLLGQGQGQ